MFDVGIIGVGTVAATHVKVLEKLEGVRIAAVADIKGKDEIRVPSGALYFSDYREMIDSVKLDAVHICLPHYLHLEAAEYVASHHIPVLCEKPVTINGEEADKMATFQDKYGVPVAVCFQNRWNATFRALQKAVESGDDGKLIGIKAVALWSRDKAYYERAPWRGIMKYAGGGCLINQAIHTLDHVLLLGGDVSTVKGIVTNVLDLGIEVEDSAVAEVVFKSGARALIMASNANVVNSTIEIEAVLENAIYTIKDFKLYRAPKDDPLNKIAIAEDDLMPGEKSYYGAGHAMLIADFYAYLSGKGGKIVTVGEAANAVKLIDLIRLSSKEGKSVQWR